jgi:DNA primase small subunit
MTDYDSVRQCCSDKKICKRCWAFIVLAAKVVDAILRADFGFSQLLWVYSGRRGIHCWVSDRAALELNDDQRKSIVGWIDVVKGGAKQDKKINLPRPLHPAIQCVARGRVVPS